MSSTARPEPASQFWGIYHTDREYARQIGDPLRTIVEATTKAAAEELAATLGFDAPWAHPVTCEVAHSLGFHTSRQQSQPQKIVQQSSRANMQPPTTAQLRTAIEVLQKLGERLNHQAAHSLMEMPKTQLGHSYSTKIGVGTIEKIGRIQAVSEQLKNWREELLQQQKQSGSHHV